MTDVSCVRREGFIEIRSTQPVVLASDSWKSVAASAGERAASRSIGGQWGSGFRLVLESVCRTSGLAGSFGRCWKCPKFPDISCVRREGFIEIRSTQPIVLASDSWKSVAASAGERAVRCSIVGQSVAKVT